MAGNPGKPGAEEQAPAKKGPGLIIWILVSAVSAGAGFAVPMFMSSSHSSGHDEGKEHEDKEAESKSAQVSFPSVIVNLNEGTLTRFLRLKLSLLCKAADEKKVTDAVEEKRLMMQSWLLSHLADKTIAEIRGTAGQQNMVRREILEKFNSLLFTDGYDRVYDVMFEEFNIQ